MTQLARELYSQIKPLFNCLIIIVAIIIVVVAIIIIIVVITIIVIYCYYDYVYYDDHHEHYYYYYYYYYYYLLTIYSTHFYHHLHQHYMIRMKLIPVKNQNKVKKRTLFNNTIQYIHIFNEIIFFKYRISQIKTTETNMKVTYRN